MPCLAPDLKFVPVVVLERVLPQVPHLERQARGQM